LIATFLRYNETKGAGVEGVEALEEIDVDKPSVTYQVSRRK